MRWFLFLCVGPLLLGTVPAAEPVGKGVRWPMDEVTLKNGATFRGQILNEGASGVNFQVVRRIPGRPTVTLTTFFARREIDSVKRLKPAERAALNRKLAELDPNGDGERERMETLELAAADWLGTPNAARRYESDQFVLVSGASEEITRRAAVRLEQIYAAFGRLLPARHAAAGPTTVLLAATGEDYAKLIGPAAGPLLNPAIFDPATNRIVCGRDLRKLSEDLTAARAHHLRQLADLAKYEADVRQLYKNNRADLDRFLDAAAKERRRIRAAEHANGALFDAATRQLFALLYHEAFHSYAANFVYPPLPAADVRAGKGTGELPRWLNEGLAQLFETAVLEAGELRVGHADAKRLERVHDRLRGKGGKPPVGLVPVADLLRAGRDRFLAAHADDRDGADQSYLTSWAATYYLTFEKRAVGTKEFDEYLTTVNGGGDPVNAFEKWVGQDAATFDRELADYLLRLHADGSVTPRK